MQNSIEGLWFAIFFSSSLVFFILKSSMKDEAEEKKKEKEIENGIFDGVNSTSRALLRKTSKIIDELSRSENIQEKMKKNIRCTFSYLSVSINRYEKKESDVVNRNKLIANSLSLYQSTINDMYNNIDLILKSDDIRTLVFQKLTLILENIAETVNVYEEATKVSKEKEVDLFAKAAIEKINSNFAMDHEVCKKIDMYKQVSKIHEELNEKWYPLKKERVNNEWEKCIEINSR